MKTLPRNAVPYKRTSEFNHSSVPSALLRAYNRMRRANPNDVPIIQLVPSSYQHREFGKVNIPRFVICGKTKYDAITEPEPELSLGDDLNDKIPF